MKLYKCDCDWKETENKAGGGVKGYILVSECDECKAKREADAFLSAKAQRKQEIITELNVLDKKAMRPLLDGETEKIDEIKSKKIALRAELADL